MFKKLIIVAILALGGLWAAGYDPVQVKNDILKTADRNAGDLSGRSALGDS